MKTLSLSQQHGHISQRPSRLSAKQQSQHETNRIFCAVGCHQTLSLVQMHLPRLFLTQSRTKRRVFALRTTKQLFASAPAVDASRFQSLFSHTTHVRSLAKHLLVHHIERNICKQSLTTKLGSANHSLGHCTSLRYRFQIF